MTAQEYQDLINPSTLLTLEEVPEFCALAESTDDLYAFLTACRARGLDDYCEAIAREIEKRSLLIPESEATLIAAWAKAWDEDVTDRFIKLISLS